MSRKEPNEKGKRKASTTSSQKDKPMMTIDDLNKSSRGQKGDKIVDYVLILKEKNLAYIMEYIKNLRVLGFEVDYEFGKTINLIFVKISISEKALRHFSEVYDIGNQEVKTLTLLHTEPIFPNPFSTPISRIIPKMPGEITEAEKIMIINQVLENTKYGEGRKQYGLSKLIRIGVLETAYPLHDGPITEDGDNVRSLLYRYWSNTGVIHKEQPLDLIHRYFGSEIAFYFAWLEYFNIMLIIPAVLGALTFLVSIMHVCLGNLKEIEEVCKATDIHVCPTCELSKNCKIRTVANYCTLAHWTYIFDNHYTITFAIFMSFWVLVSLISFPLTSIYREKRIQRSTVLVVACGIYHSEMKIGIIFVAAVLIVLLKISFQIMCESSNNPYLLMHSKILTMSCGSLVQVIFIKVYSKLYGPLSIKLTQFENPRTQHDFDNSVLYKRYLLSFTNNYVPLFYLAFVKGKLYTTPHESTFFSRHACQPLNCIFGLCLQLVFLMTLKDLAGNVFNIFFLSTKNNIQKLSRYCKGSQVVEAENEIAQWEQQYFLVPTNRFLLTTEFTEMIIKYGFVTFFVAAFPLAPLCALLNNILELRSDAYKLVKLFRRPVPISRVGIGAWNGVLLSVTYLSTGTNAFVIGFTSDWVSKAVYRHRIGNGDIKGYINSTLSKYDTSDYHAYQKLENLVPYCYYRGYHHPADSSEEYELTELFWMNLTFKFIAVFIFEHFILVCNAVLSYCIPKFPRTVTEQLNLDQQSDRHARLAEFEKTMEKSGKITKEKLRTAVKIHRD